jgi:hypothetical protein
VSIATKLQLLENDTPTKNDHLVMTNSLPWKDPPILKFGKPSMGLWAIEKPWQTVSHNQRVLAA